MSRLKHFSRNLTSSYLQLAANLAFTLISLPLALHYLSDKQWGLWALTSQMAAFATLVDMGMGASTARILIDHKDDRKSGHYGAVIKTGALVGAAQGLIVLTAGAMCIVLLGHWLSVAEDQKKHFFWLMTGQIAIVSATLVSRVFGQVLYAWQRLDIHNYVQILQLAVSLGVTWISFADGHGIYSLLTGAAAGWLCGVVICAAACAKLQLWPRSGEWGQVTKERFRELFNYGTDVFLIGLGTQLILSSQTILIQRILGAEAVALWSVMTKVYTAVCQMTWRVVGNAMPALAEMRARGEEERMWRRYRGLFIVTNVLAGACGVFLIAGNSPFITLWTHGRFAWPLINNVLLGAWLIVLTQQCCHNSMIICCKEIRGLKFAYLIEGLLVVALGWLLLPRFGMTGMLTCSLIATLLITWLKGAGQMTQLNRYAGWKTLLWEWQLPLLRLLVVLAPLEAALLYALRHSSANTQLFVNGGGLLLATGWTVARWALPAELAAEATGKLPAAAQRWLARVIKIRLPAERTS